jgi:carbonic anhydrase
MTEMPPHTGPSPIDIRPGTVTADPALPGAQFHYPARSISAAVSLEVGEGDPTEAGVEIVPQLVVTGLNAEAHLCLGGVRYDLESLHWHTPSEHWIDGRPMALELHLVHRSVDDAYAVVAVLSNPGARSGAIAPVFDAIDAFDPGSLQPGGRQRTEAELRLDRLLPSNRTTYRYCGSLTTAPFTEDVAWIVFAETLEASDEQVTKYFDLVSAPYPGYPGRPNPIGNARMLQLRMGRTVTMHPG